MSLTTHSRRTPAAAACLATALTIAGCNGPDHDAGGLDDLAELRVVEEVRVGSATDPDRGFSRIQYAFRDRHGRLYAFDAVDTKIKVFNPNGDFRHAIGRRGEGPGEFSNAVTGVGLVGDTIWVSARGIACQSSISLFDLSGEFLGSSPVPGVRIQLHSAVGVVQPGRVRPDGTRISQMNCVSGGAADVKVDVSPTDTLRIPILLFDLRGQVIDTLGWDTRLPPSPSEDSRPEMFTIEGRNHPVPRPPSSVPLNIVVPEGRLHVRRDPPQVASDGEVHITAVSFADDTLYSVSHRYTARPYSGPVLDSLAARSAEMPGGTYTVTNGVSDLVPFRDPAAAAAQIRSRMSFPEFQPPVRGSFIPGDGSFWLSREDDGGPTTRWDIFDSRGGARGHVRLPRGGRIAWSDGETVLVIESDENDVPWLVSYRFGDRDE